MICILSISGCLKGSVDVPRARISMPETTAPVINTSSDVRIVRQGQDPLAILRAAKPWDIRADISVNIGNKLSSKALTVISVSWSSQLKPTWL